MKSPVLLRDFIKVNYPTIKAFANHNNIYPGTVTKWLRGEWIVYNNKLYSPRRRIKNPTGLHDAKVPRGLQLGCISLETIKGIHIA